MPGGFKGVTPSTSHYHAYEDGEIMFGKPKVDAGQLRLHTPRTCRAHPADQFAAGGGDGPGIGGVLSRAGFPGRGALQEFVLLEGLTTREADLLLRLAATLRRPAAGRIFHWGRDLFALSPAGPLSLAAAAGLCLPVSIPAAPPDRAGKCHPVPDPDHGPSRPRRWRRQQHSSLEQLGLVGVFVPLSRGTARSGSIIWPCGPGSSSSNRA